MLTISATQAQNSFGEILDAVRREPVAITEQGHPLAYVISPEELQKWFEDQTERDKAAFAYRAYQERVGRKATPEADALTDEQVNRLVHELR
jgi:prevent-host-death family protein